MSRIVNGFEIADIRAGAAPAYNPIFTLTDAAGHSWDASIDDCSCRGLTPYLRPIDMQPCIHMISIRQWIEIMWDINQEAQDDFLDYQSWATMGGPL